MQGESSPSLSRSPAKTRWIVTDGSRLLQSPPRGSSDLSCWSAAALNHAAIDLLNLPGKMIRSRSCSLGMHNGTFKNLTKDGVNILVIKEP